MEELHVISIEKISAHFGVPLSFISELEEIKLIEIENYKNVKCIKVSSIQTLEKLIRLHYDLNINIEGLDVINNLLNQVTQLQEENLYLRNRLKRFE